MHDVEINVPQPMGGGKCPPTDGRGGGANVPQLMGGGLWFLLQIPLALLYTISQERVGPFQPNFPESGHDERVDKVLVTMTHRFR